MITLLEFCSRLSLKMTVKNFALIVETINFWNIDYPRLRGVEVGR